MFPPALPPALLPIISRRQIQFPCPALLPPCAFPAPVVKPPQSSAMLPREIPASRCSTNHLPSAICSSHGAQRPAARRHAPFRSRRQSRESAACLLLQFQSECCARRHPANFPVAPSLPTRAAQSLRPQRFDSPPLPAIF